MTYARRLALTRAVAQLRYDLDRGACGLLGLPLRRRTIREVLLRVKR